MATGNPFDLLGDDDNDDPTQLIAAALAQKASAPPVKKGPVVAAQPATKQGNLPTKPLPSSQAVREARNEGGRGQGHGAGRGFARGRGGGGYNNRESVDNENGFSNSNGYSREFRPSADGDAGKPTENRGQGGPRPPFRGGGGGNRRAGGYAHVDVAEGERPPRREYERRSGTGRGNAFKRDGAGRGNWGTPADDIAPVTDEPLNENEKTVAIEKEAVVEEAGEASKETPVVEKEEVKEPEDKEMTLDEYEKVLEEKRKALVALKAEERKVDLDKDLKAMQQLSSKKTNEEFFAKLGADKVKSKEAADKEEKAKKSVSISEFLKPAEGEKYYNPSGGRGRGGRGGRGGGARGGFNANAGGGNNTYNAKAPSIENPRDFPSLGAK